MGIHFVAEVPLIGGLKVANIFCCIFAPGDRKRRQLDDATNAYIFNHQQENVSCAGEGQCICKGENILYSIRALILLTTESRLACMRGCSSSCLFGSLSWACQKIMAHFTSCKKRTSTFHVVQLQKWKRIERRDLLCKISSGVRLIFGISHGERGLKWECDQLRLPVAEQFAEACT